MLSKFWFNYQTKTEKPSIHSYKKNTYFLQESHIVCNSLEKNMIF